MAYSHVPVMREQIAKLLAQTEQRWIVDGTVGLGGHAEFLLRHFPEVQLLGIDRDAEALEFARTRLHEFASRVRLVQGNYAELQARLEECGNPEVTGVLLDLGVSSLQIDRAGRGFSYVHDGPLDMRMDASAARSAADLLNEASETEIARVLREYGEERFARRIARALVERRQKGPFNRTSELAEVVRKCVPGRKPVSSLARVFQGVRMWVNGELENLEHGLRHVLGVLAPGSIFAVLSYHSLEDRMVKRFFRRQVEGCICPPDLPRCGCGFVARFRLLTPRVLRPGAAEVEHNVRARSARLRALQRYG